jgi:hypothetical protein
MRHIFRVDDSEYHWYSAESEQEALQMHAVEYNDYDTIEAYIEDYEEPKIEILEDDKLIKVIQDGDASDFVEQTARDWADSQRGFIASTVW